MRSVWMSRSRRVWLVFVMAAALVLSSCSSDEADKQVADEQAGVVEIEYSNDSAAAVEFDIIRVDWDDATVLLESASFGDGVDLGISGASPAQGSIETIIPGQSTDWLKLSFDSGDAPDGLTVTIVLDGGATLTRVFGS